MANNSELIQISRDILAASPFKETEVSVTSTHSMLSRYGDNVISQNVEQNSLGFGVRVIERGGAPTAKTAGKTAARTAKVTCDQADATSVKKAFERLRKIVDVMPAAEEVAELYKPGARYDKPARAAVELPSPERAAQAIAHACREAQAQRFQASGIFSADIQSSVLVNSAGLELADTLSESEFACTMEGKGGAGRGFAQEPDANHLDEKAVVARALQKCADSAGRLGEMVSIDPGHYDVVIEPMALAELLFYFQMTGLTGKGYLEDRVFCRGKLGQKILDERISLIDDPLEARVAGSFFDGLGVPKRRVALVESGVLKELATDTKTALKLGRAPTGHGTSEPNASDPIPWNLRLDWSGQKASTAELISRVKRGVFVSQFHYLNTVDVMLPSFTGMTRNGTFLIENGRITRPIHNMRFTQSALEILNGIEAVSDSTERVSMFFGGASLAPAALVRGFHFSSGTGF